VLHEELQTSTTLFPFQQEGARFLSTRTWALLADEMGLGKTAQAIVGCDTIGAERILVLCPAVARINWSREFKKFSTRSRHITVLLDGSTKIKPTDTCIICSYDLLLKNSIRSDLSQLQWEVVILDEMHYLKNRNAKRTRIVFQQLVSMATRGVWALSGTPAPNHAAELYPFLSAAGIWKDSYWAFVKRFCVTRETVYGIQFIGVQRVEELRSLLAPIMLRRKKEDVLKDLPTILFTNVLVEAGKVDMNLWYPEIARGTVPEAKIREQIAAEENSVNAILNMTGQRSDAATEALSALQEQALEQKNGQVIMSRRYLGLSKVPPIAEIIKEELNAQAYEKIVLFAWHKDVIRLLTALLQEYHPLVLYGGTPVLERDKRIQSFQTKKKHRIFIGQVKAAGVAISLTAACEVAFVESSWTPADNAQAAMRVHRIGQTKPVRVRFFGVADSTDEVIQRVLRRKTRDMVQVFDPVNNPFSD
jgi:SWI/SNF-related matrix-associated actin-dependent regulator 1 of chromatin subfamily A